MNEINRLKTLRRNRGISLELLAGELGVSLRTLWRWFKGTHRPSLMAQARIREYLEKQDRA